MSHNTNSAYRNTTKFEQPFDKAEDMALFDTLPDVVKDELNNSPYKWSARSVINMLDFGGIQYTIPALRAYAAAAWEKDWQRYDLRGANDAVKLFSRGGGPVDGSAQDEVKGTEGQEDSSDGRRGTHLSGHPAYDHRRRKRLHPQQRAGRGRRLSTRASFLQSLSLLIGPPAVE